MSANLQSYAAGEGVLAKLRSIADHIYVLSNGTRTSDYKTKPSELTAVVYSQPLSAIEVIDKLQSEITDTLRSIKCDLKREDLRRNSVTISSEDRVDLFAETPTAEQPTDLKLTIVDEDDEGETHDTGNPVGCGIVGTPFPQSNLVGG